MYFIEPQSFLNLCCLILAVEILQQSPSGFTVKMEIPLRWFFHACPASSSHPMGIARTREHTVFSVLLYPLAYIRHGIRVLC